MRKKADQQIRTSPSEIEALITRFERNELTAEDRAVTVRLLRLVLTLVSVLERKNFTIARLRRMLFGPSSDTRSPKAGSSGRTANSGPDAGCSTAKADASNPASEEGRRGHGRLPASAFRGAERVTVAHPQLRAGERCPSCDGRLFEMSDPAIHIRREGQASITARAFERERLRCSSCQEVFTAPLPESVPEERFAPSADAVIAVNRYLAGLPFHRQAFLQKLAGVPLPASVQFERCEALANRVDPVYRLLLELAAASDVIHTDDTRVRILTLRAEIEAEREANPKSTQRTGLFTTGIVAKAAAPSNGPRIAIYVSGRRHAGENSAELLTHRPEGLDPPVRVGDGSSSNRVGAITCVEAGCWFHARRPFVVLERIFPEQAGHVLDRIRELYRIDASTRGKTPADRLERHQQQSAPMLDDLAAWIRAQYDERRVEPNSSLGSALEYVLNNWQHLTEVTRTAGVPLDNNESERILKTAARSRKNSLFFRNEIGALISDVLSSVVQTCVLNDVNPIAYLTSVGRERESVRRAPSAWLPWRWAARDLPSPAAEEAA
jgi:transposase